MKSLRFPQLTPQSIIVEALAQLVEDDERNPARIFQLLDLIFGIFIASSWNY